MQIDISKITTNYSAIEKLKYELPKQLANRGLLLNEAKTEEYTINRNIKNQDTGKNANFLEHYSIQQTI